MVQNAIIIRRTTANASDLKSGALVLNNGQWGFATTDKVLVVRDLLGNFYDIPCTDLLPDLLRVKQPVNDVLSFPPGADGDLCLVKSESAYFYSYGNSWRKLADSNQIASLVSEQIALAISAHIAESDPHAQYILGTEIGTTIAPIESGKIPTQYLPSYVDDVLEFASISTFPVVGESSKIYIAIDVNKIYRWGGSSYVEVASGGVVLGETSNTAYRGDRGKIAYDHSQSTGNPHSTTIADITGLQTSLNDKLSASANPDLVAIETLTDTTGLLKKTAANTWALDTNSYATTTQLTNGSVTKIGTASIGSTTVPVYVNAGTLSACSGTLGVSITGNSATATTATKLGSSTVGSTTQPVYLNAGVPTAITGTIGNSTTGNAATATTATKLGSSTVGSTTQPVYLNAGVPTAITGTIGNSTTGNAATATTATKLATARTIALIGDVTGSINFDGSADVSITTTKKYEFDYTGGYSATNVDFAMKIASWVPSTGTSYFISFEFDYAGVAIYPWQNLPFSAIVSYRDGMFNVYYNMVGNHAGYSRIYCGMNGTSAEIWVLGYGSYIRFKGRMVTQSHSMYNVSGTVTSTIPSYLTNMGNVVRNANDSDTLDGYHLTVQPLSSARAHPTPFSIAIDMIYTNINGTVVPTKAMYSTDSTGAQKPIRALYWGANMIYPDGLGWWNWCNQEWQPFTQYMSTSLATISAGYYMITPTLSNFPNYILTGYRSGIQSVNSAHWYNNTGVNQVVRVHIAFEGWSTSSDSRYRSIQITTTPAASYSSATIQGTFAFYLNGTSSTDYTMHSYSSGWITVPAGYYLWEMAMPYKTTNDVGYFCAYDRLRNIVVQIESQTWT